MKIHINQIPVGGLHLEGEEPASILDIRDDLVRGIGPVHYALDVGLSDGGLFATGQLSVDLEMECVTCLEPFVHRLEVEDFAFQIDLGGSETVDLTEAIREDILLALPPHPHCDWDGEKTCAGVTKFSQGLTDRLGINQRREDVATGRKNPWATLDGLF